MLYIQQNRRRDDRPFERLLRAIRAFFAVVGIFVTVMAISLIMSLARLSEGMSPPPLPKRILLTYTFKSDLVEKASASALANLSLRRKPVFQDILNALDAAAKDKRVAGFAARIEDADISLAQIQELRTALRAFRASGKSAEIFTSDFAGNSTREYYLASAFGKIWLQPAGTLGLTGIAIEMPFVRDMFDKLGVQPSMQRRGTYKSAVETLTETRMSAPAREMTSALVGDLADQVASDIAADRRMKKEALQQTVNAGPYTDKEAFALKLVDQLGYRDQMLDDMKKAAPGAEEVNLEDYAAHVNKSGWGMPWKEERASGPKIALVVASGAITSQSGAEFKDEGIAADRLEKAFDEIEEDKSVVAVVLRLDTPGGSPAASETIRRAILKSRAQGRPVIVSMAGTAASGGYWIASAADRIIAQPATLTGSIGVFGGKFVLEGLWKKIGINWDAVEGADHARMFSPMRDFSEGEKARQAALLDNIYEGFIARVMEGRKLSREDVLKVAEGRVWTGRQAKARGLVDELGGMAEAVIAAKKAAKLKPEEDIPLAPFPARQSPLQMLMEMANDGIYAPVFRLDLAHTLSGLNDMAKQGGQEGLRMNGLRIE